MTNDHAILIDIGRSDMFRDAGGSDFLHAEQRDRVLRVLNAPVPRPEPTWNDTSRPAGLNVRDDRRHEAILVSARRGEGKTTFLTSILRMLEDGSYRHASPVEPLQSLYSLGIIDPTLIESKQNIIIVVIDLIRIAAEHQRKLRGDDAGNFETVRSALRKLAQGLTVLDGIGDSIYASRDWIDADYVLDKGLENASAANSFERNLREYVAAAARYIGVDAFVLAIDDVDTWFESGWPVLEAIRKYLVTPQLRIILSGDLNLYSLLVRRQQWSQMTKPFLQAEARRETADNGSSRLREIGRLVDALQDQYLIKVAPPENRVELRSLEHHAQRRHITLMGGGLREPIGEGTFIHRVSIHLLGLRSRGDIALVRQQILRLPLRSALQTLRSVAPFASPFDPIDRPYGRDAIDALRHVAWTSLTSVGVEVGESRDADAATVIETIADWLTRSRRWLQMARFLPDGSDEHGNMAAIYYGAVLVDTFHRRPGRMIDYWLKLSIVREKIDGGSVDHPQDGGTSGSVVRLVRHLNIRSAESAVQTVSRLAAWESVEGRGFGSQSSGTRFSGASVPLERPRRDRSTVRTLYGDSFVDQGGNFIFAPFQNLLEQETQTLAEVLSEMPAPLRDYHAGLLEARWSYGKRFAGLHANGVEELSERLDRNAAIALLLPRSRIVSRQRHESGNYSFLRLIAVVGQLIDTAVIGEPHTLHERVSRILSVATQARSYPTPSVDAGTEVEPLAGDGYDENEFQDAETIRQDYVDWAYGQPDLEDLIVAWLSHHVGSSLSLAPVTLSRMWTRFSYASTNVRSALRSGETRYLGVLMHRTLVAFLHAVGLEAMRAVDVQPPAGASSNPVRSSQVFVNLLQTMYRDERQDGFLETPEHAFFDMLFTCPLWEYFLRRPDMAAGGSRNQDDAHSDLSLVAMYDERTRRMRPREGPFAPQVMLRSLRRGEDAARFHGLHAILNSIPMHGDVEQGSRNRGSQTRSETIRAPRGSTTDVSSKAPRGGRDRLA